MKANVSTRLTICLIALMTTAVPKARAEVQVQDKTDISLTVFVSCAANGAGEILDLSGPLHTQITSTINGNNVSGHFHFQPQGISGTGETTGAKYQATGMTDESFKSSLQNGLANFTYVNNFRMIGQGPGNNFLVHETLHFTANANGTTTVFHDNFLVDCT